MHTRFGFSSTRVLTSALLLAGTTLLLAAGCGGSDSNGGVTPTAGAGGDSGDTSTGGDGEGGKGSAGKGGAGKGGSTSVGSAGEAGDTSQAGEGGAADLPPAKNTSAVSFVASGALSKSKHFVLISGTGEGLGGTVGSKRSKSLKYTYTPGVIAASSN
jgi:hypothetical protein